MDFSKTAHLFQNPTVGVVVQEITQSSQGRVKHDATSWPAELDTPSGEIVLLPNAPVLVVGRRGLVLLVRPLTA